LNETLKNRFGGCYIATVTPFNTAGSLDKVQIAAQARWLIESGVAGLCPAGTTGEFLYLSHDEKRYLVEHTVNAAEGKVPVVAGIWALTTAEVSDLARNAEACGADGIFLPPPIYYPADDESIYRWYASIREASELPLFAYNIPQYAANSISIACLDRLFSDGVIAGVKDSTGKTDRVSELVSSFSHRGVVFAASDGFASEGRRLGADGFISAIGNIAPSIFAQLWAGDDSLQPRVDAIRSALKRIGSIPAIKYLLTINGFPFGESRIPCSSLTTEQKSALDELNKAIGVGF